MELCANCRWFEDFHQPEDEPGDVDGYCGNDRHPSAGGYHGHWTYSGAVCPLWQPADAAVLDSRSDS